MLDINHMSVIGFQNKPDTNFASENEKKLKEQTDSFESLILKQMLDIAMEDKNSLFEKGTGSHIYQSMYHDTLSKELSGGFGYSELLFNFLTKKY
ncbi:MAG: peptidoglycan hydrolase FlgJ [Campylobacterota bacterium]|nr:peptidoglycan hydrolase FlgJ [Campylobacterota bacterium]